MNWIRQSIVSINILGLERARREPGKRIQDGLQVRSLERRKETPGNGQPTMMNTT